jgi:hypothetical protein
MSYRKGCGRATVSKSGDIRIMTYAVAMLLESRVTKRA